MFFRFRSLFLAGTCGIAAALGCDVHVDGGGKAAGDDGTVAVDESRLTALVSGRVEGSLEGSVRVLVNDSARDVVLAPDTSFVVREVPTGDVSLTVEANGLRGTLVLQGVQPGELIQVTVRIEEGAIVVVLGLREPAGEPPREVVEKEGEPLEIRANNVCYYLQPGVYERDVLILGNNVKFFGAADCSASSILEGTLTIRGNNALVQDVALRGAVVITGNNARIQDSCSQCFADACYEATGKCDEKDPGDEACDGGSAKAATSGAGGHGAGATAGAGGTGGSHEAVTGAGGSHEAVTGAGGAGGAYEAVTGAGGTGGSHEAVTGAGGSHEAVTGAGGAGGAGATTGSGGL